MPQQLRTIPTDPEAVRRRLAAVVSAVDAGTSADPSDEAARDPDPPTGRAGRLVERWLPGGNDGLTGLRGHIRRHPFGTAAIGVGLLAAAITAIVLGNGRPAAEPAPVLPAAVTVGSAPAQPSTSPSALVISVVGRVRQPGLVTLSDGARVADAIRAAGGLIPGADDTTVNLARRLADGEQIYVGVPMPSGVQDQPAAPAPPVAQAPTGHGRKGTAPLTGKVNLNTATAEELLALPGVGPATAQRIITWRGQHGHFDSIGQLREVGGIGPAKFAKLSPLVTT